MDPDIQGFLSIFQEILQNLLMRASGIEWSTDLKNMQNLQLEFQITVISAIHF
jgi:hypothetical protein